jgi:hypothetical protein
MTEFDGIFDQNPWMVTDRHPAIKPGESAILILTYLNKYVFL